MQSWKQFEKMMIMMSFEVVQILTKQQMASKGMEGSIQLQKVGTKAILLC
jgi:hypothetical protein